MLMHVTAREEGKRLLGRGLKTLCAFNDLDVQILLFVLQCGCSTGSFVTVI